MLNDDYLSTEEEKLSEIR